jgi:hypothetical protein
MSNKIVFYLKHDPTYKVILYSNTKSSAEGYLLALAKKMLALNLIVGDTIRLTGNSGLMMKNWLVALFSGSIVSNRSTLRVLLATSAANCGISSTFSLLVIHYGFLPTLVDLLQEMGRVCQGPCSAGDLQDSYNIYLNCNLFLSLFLQIKQEPSAKEHSIQTSNLMDVLQLLLLPNQCYHITLEAYFENPNFQGVQELCLSKCYFCHADHLELTTKFRCASLVSFLSTKAFLQGPEYVAKLVKVLGDNKGKLFATPVYKLNQGIIHALVLQLLAAGILSIYVIDEYKEGTSHLSIPNFLVNWAIFDNSDDQVLTHTNNLQWSSFI